MYAHPSVYQHLSDVNFVQYVVILLVFVLLLFVDSFFISHYNYNLFHKHD